MKYSPWGLTKGDGIDGTGTPMWVNDGPWLAASARDGLLSLLTSFCVLPMSSAGVALSLPIETETG